MPDENVRGLEIRAVQLQHPHSRKARESAGSESGRNRIYRETPPQHQPAQQPGGNRMQQPDCQAYQPSMDKACGLIIAETQCQHCCEA